MLRDILVSGGPILGCIVLASLVGLTIALERLWRLAQARRACSETAALLAQALAQGDVRQLERALAERGDVCALTVRAGLARRAHGAEAVRAAALDCAQRQLPSLERGLGILAAVAQVSPLLGLLGTVTGLMLAFEHTRAAESATIAVLADGIYQALGTTAAGLAVAIPAHLVYDACAAWVARLAQHLEQAASDLSEALAQGAP